MGRWRFGGGVGLLVGLGLGMAAPASALPPQQDYDRCNNYQKTFAPAQVIASCTALVEAGDVSAEARSSAYSFRGIARTAGQDYAGAVDDLTQAIALKPQEGAYSARGQTYVRLEKYDLAAADFTKASKMNPDEAAHLLERGKVRILQKDYDHAISDFGMALALDPKSATAFSLRGNAYLEKGDPDRAVADYSSAVGLDPKNVDAFMNRGNVYANQEKYPLAVADFTQVIALAPSYAPAVMNRADAYWRMGDKVRAITEHDRAAELDPDNVIYHAIRCWRRLMADRELDAAYAACSRAVELKPQAPEILNLRGMAGLKMARWRPAWEDFQMALQSDDTRADSHYGSGIARLRLGLTEGGEAEIREAKEIDPQVAEKFEAMGIKP
ncbi:tetratricopeptide repeat protein [Phenylobacterium aquaticum]|uniref:tetratricopeptide repeat protein n=1 Tax=Phenylobacterium aquaticum TaxID=1763816 RepID=UPI001F5D3BED|nr:tetratricopeptide repeat protein [Phenylobacterium aquaticum]MCI3133463.1 tetratricopeptide repeat protein [Phenylobacterium aquaticum]